MLKVTFQNMASQVEAAMNDNVNSADLSAHLLVHALNLAQDHDLRVVRAFAEGCDDNGFASDITPMAAFQGGTRSIQKLRGHLCEIFAQGVDGICKRLQDSQPARMRTCESFERMLDREMTAAVADMRQSEPAYIEHPKAGLMRYLGYAPKVVSDRYQPKLTYSRLAA